ncbi:MAG: recombinase family protein, partial [Firmicutes bacterium]|nr:recombinase family protein [Bacillota bacterium]
VNENERKTVQYIFEEFDKGKSVKEIYENIGGVISQGGIRKILRNEKYVGDLCQKKSYTKDYLSHKKKYNRGEERFIYIKDHHEGIIERALWERVKKRLEESGRNSGKYFYSGKIYCGLCKKQYVMKKKNGIEYRRCSLNAEHGKKGCKGVAMRESHIDDIINSVGTDGFRKMVIYDKYAQVYFENGICAEVYFEKSGRGKNHKMTITKTIIKN